MRNGKAFLCLTALMILMMPVPVAAKGCGLVNALPSVEVVIQETQAEYDLSRPVQALNRLGVDGSERGVHGTADVGGAMSSNIAIRHKMKFRQNLDKDGSLGCVALKSISVTIEMNPHIYIASDLKDNHCMFRELFGHEARHVEVDRGLLEKYRARFSDGLQMMLSMPSDYLSPQMPQSNLVYAQARMQEEIERGLGVLYTQMISEQRALQREVDTPGEYARLGKACQVSS